MRYRSLALTFVAALVVATNLHAAEFTDSAGRKVNLPDKVGRLLPAGPPADVLLYALAPDLLVGLVEPWNDSQKQAVPQRFQALPGVPRLTSQHLSSDDLEKLRQLKADLVVDYGDINPNYAALADRIQASLGVPYVLIDGKLREAPQVLRRLGDIIGRSERGQELAGAIQSALTLIEGAGTVAPQQRLPFYYARGADGLQGVRAGSSVGEAIELAGGRNVVPSARGAFVGLSAAEVAQLAPRIVIVGDAAAVQSGSVLRQALPDGTRFLVDLGAPYGAIEKPPSLNRILGALAIAALIHPEQASAYNAAATRLAAVLFGDSAKFEGLR
ncbi:MULTISPECIES: hypothetical protein [unclassified Beijerinckia]|uniref:hypothetical protein n=1 Tax=unclassified Beijerinckia TaxID=2638183 RepID=UPI000894804F|nr:MULTISPECIES: hypothetical protein [unclassified Beijerinckia]MDH7794743.1 iron complex transport system substrate-binding protein [Beijerinckia sp. GAS462]SEB73511.1 iron complex transport system substrate-binding protein [Beijerinckia sp. 28-YEA-48]